MRTDSAGYTWELATEIALDTNFSMAERLDAMNWIDDQVGCEPTTAETFETALADLQQGV